MQTRLSRQQAASTGGTRTNHGIRQRNSRAPTRTCAAAVDGAASTSLPPLVAVDGALVLNGCSYVDVSEALCHRLLHVLMIFCELASGQGAAVML